MSPPSDSSYCRRSRLHLFLILPALFTLARSQCYNANGTVATDPDYAPCSNSTSDPLHTICCSLNRDNPPGGDPSVAGFTRDECLANGICQNKWSQNGGHTTSYFREKCTEKDWSTGLCLDVCTDSVDDAGNSYMTPCDGTPTSEKWCCGMTDSCCDTDAVLLPRTFGAALSSTSTSASVATSSSSSATTLASSASSPTSEPTASPTLSPSPSPSTSAEANADATTQPSSSTGLSAGAKAGAAIGAIAGVAAFFSIGYLIARRRHGWTSWRSGHAGVHEKGVSEGNHDNGYYPPPVKDVTYHMAAAEIQELDGGNVAAEAPSGERWKSQELP
ncbi:hypothetical protein BU26DRAFT_506919 [Trematosphaeria pertusa]|uniref:Mid2 domain-containing protein n=1 Tax=Trematosphaeria pertusa TaxID=390896 RepID=A0A6A6IAY0_9PLEO|nr:uncharacterized protein BU26DRAFT_506919 [Trematosphaeria pertusa]KAF2247734.1 hypothetical protein BU26DRAFT_506919 [Trematosphaeria pertusa]